MGKREKISDIQGGTISGRRQYEGSKSSVKSTSVGEKARGNSSRTNTRLNKNGQSQNGSGGHTSPIRNIIK